MIQNRPPSLLDVPHYKGFPSGQFSLDINALPDLLKLDVLDLSGVQPITREIADAAGGALRDTLSEGEIALHRQRGSEFQLVQIVVNMFDIRPSPSGGHVGRPYSIALAPAMKRDQVATVSVERLTRTDLERLDLERKAYLGFDPFVLDRGLYGDIELFAQEGALVNLYTDELGVVAGGYFLTRPFAPDSVLTPETGIANADAARRYQRHRVRRYFKWFADGRPRRVWGLDSPIELFLAQAMARIDLRPALQSIILRDGGVFPSLFELMADPDFTANPEIITAADFYFADQRFAVFCDSTKHHRSAEQRARDERIDGDLRHLGISPLRIRGKQIADDPIAAAARVAEAVP